MALFLPPATTINNLAGGYNASLDFMVLADNQTNNANNVEITKSRGIKKRNGYRRMLNTALAETGLRDVTSETGERIKGIYEIVKFGNRG